MFSISHSPKGWTDQELGSAWLENDFEPVTAARNKSGGYRLLILDGHNSHTTYRFCTFAEKHKIILLCLPSHTTHRLQPCDVGVFGPLSATWKAEVNVASRENMVIRKHNVISYYSRAREKAFTTTTIRNAFRKTGIWPLNPDVIEEDAFAPALNTTTQAAQPVAATIPDCVVVVPPPANPTADTSLNSISTADTTPISSTTTATSTSAESSQTLPSSTGSEIKFSIKLPRKLGSNATSASLRAQNEELRYLLDQACYQMEKDFALKKLMDKENERLRKELYNRQNKPKKRLATGFARHMTSEDSLIALAREEWSVAMREIFKSPVFKEQRDKYERYCKEMAAKEKEREREEAKVAREAERLRVRQEKSLAQEAQRREREQQKSIRDEVKRQEAAAKAAAKAKKAAMAAKKKETARLSKKKKKKEVNDHDTDSGENEQCAAPPPRPRPRPIPKKIPPRIVTHAYEETSPAQASSTPVVLPTEAEEPGEQIPLLGGSELPNSENEHANTARRSNRTRRQVKRLY